MRFPYTSKKVPCEASPLAGDICAKESLIPSCTLFFMKETHLRYFRISTRLSEAFLYINSCYCIFLLAAPFAIRGKRLQNIMLKGQLEDPVLLLRREFCINDTDLKENWRIIIYYIFCWESYGFDVKCIYL